MLMIKGRCVCGSAAGSRLPECPLNSMGKWRLQIARHFTNRELEQRTICKDNDSAMIRSASQPRSKGSAILCKYKDNKRNGSNIQRFYSRNTGNTVVTMGNVGDGHVGDSRNSNIRRGFATTIVHHQEQLEKVSI